jgi:hypothetical protein
MTSVTTKPELSQPTTESNSHLFDGWFDPIETGIRDRVRGLIEEMICGELAAVLLARTTAGARWLRMAAMSPRMLPAIGMAAGYAR